jgi:hypothetical protein
VRILFGLARTSRLVGVIEGELAEAGELRAYVLLCALRRIALRHTQFAEATCGTIRLKLLKIGALVRVSVRRIKIAMASACPCQNDFALAQLRLTAAAR